MSEATEKAARDAGRQAAIANHFETAHDEALLYLTKCFRGAVDLGDKGNKALLGAATATTSSFTRQQQTLSARVAIGATLADRIAHDDAGKFAAALQITLPEYRVARALGSGE